MSRDAEYPEVPMDITMVDATIRDGGYANDYGFSNADVQRIVTGLGAAGVSMIEIGHGYGLGAERTLGRMAEAESSYIEHVMADERLARIGMFANANIANRRDVRRAARLGLDFVRVGFIGFDGPHPFARALDLIEEAKNSGLWVSANLVRTQMYSHAELALLAERLSQAQVNAIYVVDSPGGALPRQVEAMVRQLRDHSDAPVGFHGHQNLDLGVANSLAAVQAGASMVDGTLRGVGRDSGNAQLDVLVAVLEKAGFATACDVERLAAVGAESVAPLFEHPVGVNEENLLLGRYDLLSHAVPLARSVGAAYAVDWRWLLRETGARGVRFEHEAAMVTLAEEARACVPL